MSGNERASHRIAYHLSIFVRVSRIRILAHPDPCVWCGAFIGVVHSSARLCANDGACGARAERHGRTRAVSGMARRGERAEGVIDAHIASVSLIYEYFQSDGSSLCNLSITVRDRD